MQLEISLKAVHFAYCVPYRLTSLVLRVDQYRNIHSAGIIFQSLARLYRDQLDLYNGTAEVLALRKALSRTLWLSPCEEGGPCGFLSCRLLPLRSWHCKYE